MSLLYKDEQVIEARKYLALSYHLLGKPDAASEEFAKLLYLSPDYQLDPYTVPPRLVELLETVRARMKPELDAIRQRKSDEQLQSATKQGRVVTIEQTMVERSDFATLLPFGVGQFQNGDYGWGAIFAGTELALIAVNVGAYLAATSYGPTYSNKKLQTRVQALTVTQYGALTLFGFAWSLGVFQARLNFQPLTPGARVVHDEQQSALPTGAGGLMRLDLRF